MTNQQARVLRKRQTDAERLLWAHLRDRRLVTYKFRRQHPLGPYIVDFVCLKQRLVVEVDGGQHTANAASDEQRDAWLASQGFGVVRFWDNQVLLQLDAVKVAIASALDPSS